jgi:hypothetical protein
LVDLIFDGATTNSTRRWMGRRWGASADATPATSESPCDALDNCAFCAIVIAIPRHRDHPFRAVAITSLRWRSRISARAAERAEGAREERR